MSNRAELAIDQSNCIVEKTYFTQTAYHNICDNAVTYVPNSVIDYLSVSMMVLCVVLFACFAGFLIASVTSYIKDQTNW